MDVGSRTEIKENLVEYLKVTNKAYIIKFMKMWLYNNFIVAYVTWPFMVYDLPISYGEKLRAVLAVNKKHH